MTDKTVTVSARISVEDRDYLFKKVKDNGLRTLLESVVQNLKSGNIELHNGKVRVVKLS